MTDNEDTDTIDALTDQIDELIETIEEQQQRIEELERRVEDDKGDDETDPSELIDIRSDGDSAGLMDVWITGIPMGKLLHRALERLDTVEEEVEAIEEGGSEASNQGSEAAEGGSTLHDLLPIDRIVLEDEVEDCTMGNVTASVERAAAIYENFRQWSSKTPRGRTIRTSTDGKGPSLKSLVATATDEDISWKQVIRACKKLEEWSKGVIEFKKTSRQGWVLVAPDDIAVGHGRPSSVADQPESSVAAT